MAAKPSGILIWDLKNLSDSLKIKESDVKLYFTDGRRVSFLLERRICNEVIKGKLATSEGAGYDLVDPEGNKWEVRSISSGGIYFCPSYMVGSGRSFNKSGFLEKLAEIEGYIISDITKFPEIPFWILNKQSVIKWWNAGLLGNATKISRASALNLLNSL